MEKRTSKRRRWRFRLKQKKLNYRFHNPNSAEDTANFLCKLLIEANAGKVERVIEEAARKSTDKNECKEMHPVLVHIENEKHKNEKFKAGYEIFSHIQP